MSQLQYFMQMMIYRPHQYLKQKPALNQQFHSVFTKEDNNTPIISSPQYPNMPEVIFTTNGIQKLLEDLKPGKAAGPDNIPIWTLKVCAVQIAPILQIVFTQIFNSGTLPSDWLTANAIPRYKKGDESLPVNYRPISVTSVCVK